MASKNRPRATGNRKSPWVRRIKQGLILFASVVLIAASILGILYNNAYNDAKEAMLDLQKHIDSVNKPTSKILSSDGEVLFSVSSEYRIPLKLSQIPKFVQNAVLAAEDKRFYKHTGVDMTALARIVFVAAGKHRVSQGGSTITMQLVKLLFNGSSRTFKRKMNDIAYANVLEQNLPKDQILELYLNKVFFGEGAFGIGEAARVYFGKNIDELTLGEAAMLARCIRLPSTENPIRDINKALENRDVVLGIMLDEQMITQAQYDKAVNEKPHVNPKPSGGGVKVKPGAEYFVDHVIRFVEKDMGLSLVNGGYTIETTLDYKLQRFTENAVREIVDENRDQKVNQGAFMVMDSDGKILAEVGGLNYRHHQQNIITSGTLQPGSGFKAILYATALKAGVINMGSMLSNAPIVKVDSNGRVWKPGNSSRRENAPQYSLRSAFAQSVNLPAIHTIEMIGPEAVVETAHDIFGIRSKLEPFETLALGASAVAPIEMAEAYSVFMLRGDRVRPQPVVRILDADGAVVKQYDPNRFVSVFDPEICDDMDQLLRAVVEEGTGQAARPVPNARGKTGTTNDAKDAWFTGYTDGLLGVGWVGNEKKIKGTWTPVPMSDSVYGGTVTARIWAKVMAEAQKKYGKAQPNRSPSEPTAPKKATAADSEVGDLMAPPDDTTDDTSKTTDDAGDTGTPIKSGDPSGAPPETANDTGKGDPASTPGDSKTKPDEGTPPDTKADAPKKGTAKHSSKTPSKSNESDTVSVEICAESGLRANRYCNETVTRTFPRGQEPKRVCRIHGPG